jgi:hypothetical protein
MSAVTQRPDILHSVGQVRFVPKPQTATSEVLQVISSSPGELEPVFRSMLEKTRGLVSLSGRNFLFAPNELKCVKTAGGNCHKSPYSFPGRRLCYRINIRHCLLCGTGASAQESLCKGLGTFFR